MRINKRDGEPLEEPLQFALLNGKKPQTFGEFRRRIVEELPEAIATDTGCADLLFPIELVCDIKEKDVEWLTDLFDSDRNTCFGPTKVRLFSFVENALG